MSLHYSEDQKINPFIHRWKLNDPAWILKRKEQWPFVEANLICEGKKNKQLKHFKAFYVYGKEPPNKIGFHGSHRLAYTPCNTEDEVREVFNYGPPSEYLRMLHLGAWGDVTNLNNPFGYAGGQEVLIAKALFSQFYCEKYENYKGKKIAKFIAATEYVDRYVMSSYRYLTSYVERKHVPLLCNINYFISCIKHIESTKEQVELHPWILNLLSLAYNLVEPRAPLGKITEVASFAKKLTKRLQQDDIPLCLKESITRLGPNQLLEYSVEETPAHEVVFLQRLYGPWSAPYPRVIHGLEPTAALAAVLGSARRVKFLPSDYRLPEAESINLRPLVTEQFCRSLGYGNDDNIPCYRYTIWFSPNRRFSNNPNARFGVDLLVPKLPTDKEIKYITPTLIYFPRLSEHYRHWHTTEILLLLERQLRRDIYFRVGVFLIDYDGSSEKNLDDVLPDYFNEHFSLEPGYDVINDYKSGSMELALDGPDIEEWAGEPLPPAPTEGQTLVKMSMEPTLSFARNRSNGSALDKGYISLAAIITVDMTLSPQIVKTLLLADSRPDFDDQLPDEHKALFNVIDRLPFPNDLIILNKQQLFVEWRYLEEDLDEFDTSLQQVGLTISKAQVFPDDPFVVPEEDGLYYTRQPSHGLVSINPRGKGMKMPEDFQEKMDLPVQLQALLQEF